MAGQIAGAAVDGDAIGEVARRFADVVGP